MTSAIPAAHDPSDEAAPLGEPPLIVIRATSGWRRVAIGELWVYRDLLYFLTRREVSVRYKQTVLGVAWALLQPLLTMVVFAVFLGRLAKVPSDGIPYPIFAYLGLLPWTYFSGAVARSSASLVGNASLLTKVYFPRVLIPLSAVLSALLDLVLATALLAVLMAWYGLHPAPTAWLLGPIFLLASVLAAGVGLWLASLNVRYRDVQHAVPFLFQIWLFATPIAYPASLVPSAWRSLFALNPMTGIVEASRAAVLGRPFDTFTLGVSAAGSLLLAAVGLWQFGRAERTFADVV